MVRPTVTLLLISSLLVQPIFAAAQEPTLETRLRDMHGEAARFLDRIPESERAWAAQDSSRPSEAMESQRLRVLLGAVPSGTKVQLVLKDGVSVEGEREDVAEENFALSIEVNEQTTRDLDLPDLGEVDSVHWRFAYEDVDSVEIDGWNKPGALHDLSSGKRLEAILLDGSKVEGKLRDIGDTRIRLDLGRNNETEYSLGEVVGFRTLGMSAGWKALIFVGVLFGIGVAALAANPPQ